MKKHYYAAFLMAALLLFPALQLDAQEEKNEYLWYCWEETVTPDMLDEYLDLSKEVMLLFKEENHPL